MDHAFIVLNITTARLWYLLENIQFNSAGTLFSNFLTLWTHVMRSMKLSANGINPVQETKFTVVG